MGSNVWCWVSEAPLCSRWCWGARWLWIAVLQLKSWHIFNILDGLIITCWPAGGTRLWEAAGQDRQHMEAQTEEVSPLAALSPGAVQLC